MGMFGGGVAPLWAAAAEGVAADVAAGEAVVDKSLDPNFPLTNLLATLPAQSTVTIEFEVQVKPYAQWSGFPLSQICDQHTVTDGAAGLSVVTDDPAVGGTTDPTCLSLDTADLVISKTDSADPVVAGTALAYTVTVLNNGPAAAQNVVVTDTLPAGVTFVSTSGCAEDPVGVPTCTLGSIANGAMAQYTVNVTVDGDTTGSITNNVSVVSAREAAPGNETASESTTIGSEADLTISKTDSVDPVNAGDPLTYTVSVSNAGPSTAADVVVTDTLPAGVTLVSTSGCAEDPVGVPTCTLGSIANGAMAQYSIDVTVNNDTNGSITNNATVASSTVLINTGDDSTDEDTQVNGEVTLTLSKTDAPDPVIAGNQLTYSFSVDNGGPGDAIGTQLFDLLPLGTTYASDTLAACTEPPDLVGYAASLDQTAVASGSPATAAASFFLDTTGEELRFVLDVDDMANAITGATLRKALDDSLVHDLYASGATFDNGNGISGVIQLTTPQAMELQAETHYVDIRSAAFPNGEIRGTLIAAASGALVCDLGAVASGGNVSFDLVVDVASGVAASSLLTNLALVDSDLGDPAAVVVPPAGIITGDRARTDTTVQTTADLVITKTDDVDPVSAGNNLVYTLSVTNNGPSDALDVVITESLPMGVSLVSTSGCAEDPAAVPNCTLGTVVAGDTAMVTITVSVGAGTTGTLTNQASVTASTPLSNPGDDSTSEDTAVQVQSDLVISKIDDVDPVLAGNALNYTVTVLNNGPSNASGVVVTDTLPSGVTLVSTSGCAEDPAGVPTCNLGDLAAGGNTQFTIAVGVDSDASGVLTNSAAVTAASPLVNTGDDSVDEMTTIEVQADLAITKVDDVDPVVSGDDLTYTLTVTNNGPSDALAVVATDTLPAGVTLVSTSGCAEDPTAVPTCSLGNLTAGASVQYSVVVNVDLATSGTITNMASVTSDTADPTMGNNSTSEDTEAQVQADLTLVKSDSEDPVAGQSFTYTLEVTNNGPSTATSVEITDDLPSGLVFNSSPDGCTEMAGTVTCVIGDMTAGQMESRSFVVDLMPPFPGVVTNTATVSADQVDPNPSDNSDSEDTTLDIVPPTVTNIDTVYDTGDGSLEECETVNRNWVQRLLVTFSESMFDPMGDSDADDVTNPANYQLLTPGADRSFQTDACGGPQGDDQVIAVTGVSYDDGSLTADLTLALELPDDLYRLEVCGSTTLVDLAGNALDGDGDGTGGDDFQRGFRVDNANRFANGHFDCDLTAWTVTSTNPAEIVHDGLDFEASDQSGSARVENLTQSQAFQLDQCVDVLGGGEHRLSLELDLTTDPEIAVTLNRFCELFSAPSCGGANLGPEFAATLIFSSGGDFVSLDFDFMAPATALSALCGVSLSTSSGDSFVAHVDALTLVTLGSVFNDGFESGDLSAWSAAVP